MTPRLPVVQDSSGCASQLISPSDEEIFPKLFQKVSPRTAVSSETIHEKCILGGLRGGLGSDNDLLRKKIVLMYCNFSHQKMKFFCDLILDLAI